MTIEAGLTGVPETALWTLHNRASEARRGDGRLDDPWAVTLFEALEHPYRERFGAPSQTHALQARCFDHVLRTRIAQLPDASVVALGEGLQTTYWRLGRPDVPWLTVDVPEVIALRERLLPREGRVRAWPGSALDRGWMEAVEDREASATTVSAEGLLMYFTREDALRLVADVAARFPGGQMIADTIPPVLSRKTLSGWRLTPSYTAPPMPFGTTVPDMLALPTIVPGVERVEELALPSGRRLWRRPVVRTVTSLPVLRAHHPACFRIVFAR